MTASIKESKDTITIGGKRFDPKGIRGRYGDSYLCQWRQMTAFHYELSRKGRRIAYRIEISTGAEDPRVYWIGNGKKHFRNLARILKWAYRAIPMLIKWEDCKEVVELAEWGTDEMLNASDLRGKKLQKRARFWELAQDFSKARSDCRKLFGEEGLDLEARRIYMRTLLYRDQLGKAERQLKHILKRHPDDHEAEVDFAYACLNSGRRKGEKIASRLLERNCPDSVDVGLQLSAYYANKGSYDKALDTLGKAESKVSGFDDRATGAISSMRAEVSNMKDFRGRRFSLPNLSSIVAYGFLIAICYRLLMPSFDVLPEVYRKSLAILDLQESGVQSKFVEIRPRLIEEKYGIKRLEFRYADKFVTDAKGRMHPTFWRTGKSFLDADEAGEILKNSDLQYVTYDQESPEVAEVGSLSTARIFPLWAKSMDKLSGFFGSLILFVCGTGIVTLRRRRSFSR